MVVIAPPTHNFSIGEYCTTMGTAGGDFRDINFALAILTTTEAGKVALTAVVVGILYIHATITAES